MFVTYLIRAEPVKLFHSEPERFESNVTTAASLVVETGLRNRPRRHTGLGGNRSGVDTSRRIVDHSAEQLIEHKQASSDHRGIIPADRQQTCLGEKPTPFWDVGKVVLRSSLAGWFEPVVLRKFRGAEGDLGAQQVVWPRA